MKLLPKLYNGEIQKILKIRIFGGRGLYYSYVMGIDDSILSLKDKGFVIEKVESNYQVTFSKENAQIWEDFIKNYLEVEYWNEYLAEDKVVFIFHLEDGFKRYEVENYDNDEVLDLCEKLCNCKFASIKQMLADNSFYKKIIEQ